MTLPGSDPLSGFARFGAALDGQYTLECEIGRGGMGVVYRARDLRLDRRVAIKTLPPHLANDSTVRERFLREARTAGALSHPRIVPIHRADELSGHVFFVMGFVDGESVAQRIQSHGPLDARETVSVLRDAAAALHYAHSRGVVHRDVKAENILLDRNTGAAMVTDFGIARLAEAAPLTATGQVLGTVYYLSPEQVSGDDVDARSDIYSLGVVGFLALTGRFPFNAELASAVLVAHVNKPAPPVRAIAPATPRALGDIIDRCLGKNPQARFASCDDLLGALSTIDFSDIAAPHATPLVSDTEAHAILGRAADLQASTGLEPRPEAVLGTRDAARDATRTSGHRAHDLRDAAVEAGIPAKYVDHAMAEHGLVSSNDRSPVGVEIIEQTDRSAPIIGAPTRLEYEVVIDGEMPIEDFDLLVDIIRQSMGEAGEMTTVGRAFSWRSDPRRANVTVSILPRGGKTRIRVLEGIQNAAAGSYMGFMGGIAGMSTPIWLGLGLKLHQPMMALGWAGTVLLSYISSRAVFSHLARSHDRRLRQLAERLGAQARESVEFVKDNKGGDTHPPLPKPQR